MVPWPLHRRSEWSTKSASSCRPAASPCPAREPIQAQDSNRRQQRGQRNACCWPPVKGTGFENGHTNQGERNPRALGRHSDRGLFRLAEEPVEGDAFIIQAVGIY